MESYQHEQSVVVITIPDTIVAHEIVKEEQEVLPHTHTGFMVPKVAAMSAHYSH